MDLYDGTLVQTTPVENGWLSVGVVVAVENHDLNLRQILPGTKLYSPRNILIGQTKDTVDVWIGDEKSVLIGGYTHEGNIKKESIPEQALIEKIDHGGISLSELSSFLIDFQFNDYPEPVLQSCRQFYIAQSLLVDMSPRDRISLFFRENQLIAAVHSRELDLKEFKTFPLTRRHKLTIISDLQAPEINEIRLTLIDFYNSID